MKSTFANQNIFEINRDMPAKGAKRPYIAIYNDNLFGAMQELSGEAAIKLYIYLAANQNGFNLNFSPKHFALECGMSENNARAAAKQLMEKNYLVQDDTNHYKFYEVPKKSIEFINRKDNERRLAKTTDGFIEITYAAFREETKASGWTDKDIDDNWETFEVVEENQR